MDSKIDPILLKKIEKILAEPRPVFQSPSEFSFFLAAQLEPYISKREKNAFLSGLNQNTKTNANLKNRQNNVDVQKG